MKVALRLAAQSRSESGGTGKLKQLRPTLQLVVIEGATHAGSDGILGKPEFLKTLRAFLAEHRIQ